MKQTAKTIVFSILINSCFMLSAHAATYYVSPTGNNSAAGSSSQPFATLQKGNDVAAAGDTVYIHGGTYSITTPSNSGAGITITKSGTSDTKRIYFWAVPGEIPVFDFSKMNIQNGAYTHGVVVTGSWLHFKGLEICNVPMNTKSNCGMHVNSTHDNIFEFMNFHHNNGAGVFVDESKSGLGGHLFLNCDSHDNYDPGSNQGDGQNADGFGCHYQTSGNSTTYKYCRSWWNSDDGWDLISQEVPVIIDHCWAMGCGWANSGTKHPSSGNGNGFKAGSSKNGVRHIIRNCVAWKNTAAGYYANHSSGGNTWYNNTSYNNGTQYNMLASDPNNSATTIILSGTKVHIMRNNIGYPNKNSNMTGVDTKFNSWDLNITPVDKDFLTLTDPSMTVTNQTMATLPGALGPRKANGSLPNTDFLKLAAGSQMIDVGTDVQLPFVGKAPDLGAREYGDNTLVQTHTGFNQNIAVKTSQKIIMENRAGIGRNDAAVNRTLVFTVTGKRVYPSASGKSMMGLPAGVYIQKYLK